MTGPVPVITETETGLYGSGCCAMLLLSGLEVPGLGLVNRLGLFGHL